MERQELLEKIRDRRMYRSLPFADISAALDSIDKKTLTDEERIKKTRDVLRRAFSSFAGRKLLNWKGRSPEEILAKHLSTRERLPHYEEIYSRLLSHLPEKLSVLDLGAGVNGLSYPFFARVGKTVSYVGVEAVGELVTFMQAYFSSAKISGEAHHVSLFELGKVKELMEKTKKPRVIFLFKTIDSLEALERNYSKRFILETLPLVDRFVVSFATKSMMRRRSFHATRKWLTDFLEKETNILDDFEVGGERYIVFEQK